MAALSAASDRRARKIYSWLESHRVDNSVVIYVGAYLGFPGANALTSGRGYVDLWQDESTIMWAGLAESQSSTNSLSTSLAVTGDTSASPVPEITVEMGPFVVERATVTGVSAQANVWRTAVYASNDNDLTTTASTYAGQVARVVYWHSSTTADVAFFGAIPHIML